MESVARRFFEAPDAHDEPTLWERNDKYPEYPQPILARYDLPAKVRHELWPLIVDAVVGER